MSLLDSFRKKDSSDVPDISEMIANGMSEQDIIDNLRQQGYDSTAIKEALINGLNKGAQQGTQNASAQKQQPVAPQEPPQIRPMNLSQPTPIAADTPRYNTQQLSAPKQEQPKQLSDQTLETIQQVLEQIIGERWNSASGDINNMKITIKNNSNSISEIEDRLDGLGQRIDGVQNTMLGKTEEYNKTISDVNVELKAFEKVIDRLVPTISDSIKELRDLIDNFKKQT